MVKIQYLNENRVFDINSDIVEWDIKSAGISIIREYKMLPESRIEKLLKLPKDMRNISIGKIGQKDKDFSKELENKFNYVVDEFIKNNNLDIEYDILSVKRDAIFTVNKVISNSMVGEFIHFIPKNNYHAYLYVKPYEIYFKTNNEIDIKGLCGDPVERSRLLNLHKDGIVNFLNETINLCEQSSMDTNKINKFCASFVSMYKNRVLEFAYYREFSVESMFRYNIMGNEMMIENIDASLLNNIDIQYNYINIILPIVNLIC